MIYSSRSRSVLWVTCLETRKLGIGQRLLVPTLVFSFSIISFTFHLSSREIILPYETFWTSCCHMRVPFSPPVRAFCLSRIGLFTIPTSCQLFTLVHYNRTLLTRALALPLLRSYARKSAHEHEYTLGGGWTSEIDLWG